VIEHMRTNLTCLDFFVIVIWLLVESIYCNFPLSKNKITPPELSVI
jgi:hypothetical protein